MHNIERDITWRDHVNEILETINIISNLALIASKSFNLNNRRITLFTKFISGV